MIGRRENIVHVGKDREYFRQDYRCRVDGVGDDAALQSWGIQQIKISNVTHESNVIL